MNDIFYKREMDGTTPIAHINFDKIKDISYNYILYLIYKWKSQIPSNKTGNRIGLSLLPFYYAASNGHSESLYKGLGPWKMTHFGLISEESISLLQNLETSNNKYFDLKDGTIIEKKTINDIYRELLEHEIESNVRFKDVLVQKTKDSTFSPLYLALESSENAIKIRSKEFVNMDLNYFRKINENNLIGVNSNVPVPYEWAKVSVIDYLPK